MITRFFPFCGINETDLNRNILSGTFQKLKDLFPELKDLLNKILEVNPRKRISVDEKLKHPYLSDINANNTNYNNNAYYF